MLELGEELVLVQVLVAFFALLHSWYLSMNQSHLYFGAVLLKITLIQIRYTKRQPILTNTNILNRLKLARKLIIQPLHDLNICHNILHQSNALFVA